MIAETQWGITLEEPQAGSGKPVGGGGPGAQCSGIPGAVLLGLTSRLPKAHIRGTLDCPEDQAAHGQPRDWEALPSAGAPKDLPQPRSRRSHHPRRTGFTRTQASRESTPAGPPSSTEQAPELGLLGLADRWTGLDQILPQGLVILHDGLCQPPL
jgi:hypothetical protein